MRQGRCVLFLPPASSQRSNTVLCLVTLAVPLKLLIGTFPSEQHLFPVGAEALQVFPLPVHAEGEPELLLQRCARCVALGVNCFSRKWRGGLGFKENLGPHQKPKCGQAVLRAELS